MTQLCENDRVEPIQAGVERRLFFSYVVDNSALGWGATPGTEGALTGVAIVTERPGA